MVGGFGSLTDFHKACECGEPFVCPLSEGECAGRFCGCFFSGCAALFSRRNKHAFNCVCFCEGEGDFRVGECVEESFGDLSALVADSHPVLAV